MLKCYPSLYRWLSHLLFGFPQMIFFILKRITEKTCWPIQGYRELQLASYGKVATQVCCPCCCHPDFIIIIQTSVSFVLNKDDLITGTKSKSCYDHNGQISWWLKFLKQTLKQLLHPVFGEI